MVSRVQTIRYYTALERPPTTEFSGELYINFADIQIGALDTSKSPVDFVAVRYYSQLTTYVAGDFTVYNGSLYRCLENGTTGAFDETRWSEILDLREIQVLIAIETTRAKAAEQHLQDEIDAEIAAREAADTNLQNEINTINSELGSLFPPGISLDYYGSVAPTGWLLENGASYPVNTYPALGALLGGSPGGSFTVPNSVGRFGVGAGGAYPLFSVGGTASAILSAGNIPSHTHTIQPHNHPGGSSTHSHGIDWGLVVVSGEGIEGGLGPTGFFPSSTTRTQDATAAFTVANSTVLTTDPYGGAGGGTTAPINTLPPYISRTRIIKT